MDIRRSKIKTLIYRNIGGIGDALTMIPGILTYIKVHKEEQVTVAFPVYCHPVFKHLVPVVDSATIDPLKFEKVIDLGNPSPAAVYESKYKEKVEYSRLQIFSKHLGLDPKTVKTSIILFSKNESEQLSMLRKSNKGNILGIGTNSSEGYRDYPGMKELIENCCNLEYIDKVFVFGTVDYPIEHKKIVTVPRMLRTSFIYQYMCKLFITVDSLFLHSAAAMNVPTILLDGPLASESRFNGYPLVKRINSSDECKCIPCWRNGLIPCVWDPFDKSYSKCMDLIRTQIIIKEIDAYFSKIH